MSVSYTFPRRCRLSKRSDVLRIFTKGTHIASEGIYLFYDVNDCKEALGHCRLGVGVAKKYIGKAADRNLVKRRIRYVLRHELPWFRERQPANTQLDIFISYRNREVLAYQTMHKHIVALLTDCINLASCFDETSC